MRKQVRNEKRSKFPKTHSDVDRFAAILHPKWCSRDDYALLQAKERGESFAKIAAELQRPTRAVEQRFHQLRAVKGIDRLLLRFGLVDRPYDINAPVILNTPEETR